MTKDTSYQVLRLISFINEAILSSNDMKIFYYGPTVVGLTTNNVVQFSIDVTSKDNGSSLSQIDLLKNVF
jgi:hypothetical protein